MALSNTHLLLLFITILVLLPAPAAAFGAGNIASLSTIEGHNWRHGDIEDVLTGLLFLHGKKWTAKDIKRVYFGNWLRDYSQAVDVGTLKGVQADTIRVLVWVLAFTSFGYATREFEVTPERLGVYRPEEHIDNPKDYADNLDATQYDSRLRGPVRPQELAIDPHTGMKNYIANERSGFASSAGYVRWSLEKSIHHGRLYTKGSHPKKEDLWEGLRCLGQALHCLEDFGAHTNYVELALRELGHHNVFPHVGSQSQINLRGKTVFPLVTGTFGGVDFLHSVLGEATDTVAQSELDDVNSALGSSSSSNTKTRGPGGESNNSDSFISALSALENLPGLGSFCDEAKRLQAQSDRDAAAQNQYHGSQGYDNYSQSRGMGYDDYSQSRAGPGYGAPPTFQAPPGSVGGPPGPNIPGTNTDPQQVIGKIKPILVFRDNVARAISGFIRKVPGLEKLLDTVSERLQLFIFGLLAPYVQPLIKAASKQLKEGSSTVVDASAKQQYIVWNDPHSTDPTHSMLSKDHFSNILNSPAGEVAAEIVKYAVPRVIYAWEHPNVPVSEVVNDVLRAFHHPAARDLRAELHNNMFRVVENWSRRRHPYNIDQILSSQSVKDGKNHLGGDGNPHLSSKPHKHTQPGGHSGAHSGGHKHSNSASKPSDPFSTFASNLTSGLNSIPGVKIPSASLNPFSSSRELYPDDESNPSRPSSSYAADPNFNPYPSSVNTAYDSQPYSAAAPSSTYFGNTGGAPPQHGYGAPDAYNSAPPASGYSGYDQHAPPAHDPYAAPQQHGYDAYPPAQQNQSGYYDHQAPPAGGADPYAAHPPPGGYQGGGGAYGQDQYAQGGGYDNSQGGYDSNQGGYDSTQQSGGGGWFRQ